jgi:hypothetical protein
MTQREMTARIERVEKQNQRLKRGGLAVIALIGAMWYVSGVSSQEAPTTVAPETLTYDRIAVRVAYDANFPDWRKSIEREIARYADHRLVSVTSDARDNFWLFFESGSIPVKGEVVVSGGPVSVTGGPVIMRTP